jgi:hypothetical protein
MPRSHNRRTIEVPLPLYEELSARAAQDGTTIAAVLQALITDGKTMHEWFGRIEAQLHELRRELQRRAPAGGAAASPRDERPTS